jgi:glucosyl-3-phosphoglycerate synthase
LLNLHWPELSGVIQPLSGEYAARRSLLEQLPFPTGYGIELAMLIDTLQLRGLNAIAQVDVGERQHRHQNLQALGRMAAEIWQIGMDRLDRDGHIVTVREPHTSLTQFESTMDGHTAFASDITVAQRPPAVAISQYTDRVLLE